MVPRPEHPHMHSLAWYVFLYWPVYTYGLHSGSVNRVRLLGPSGPVVLAEL